MTERVECPVVRPTREQIARFSAATDDERFRWWLGMLTMLDGAVDAKTRRSWRAFRERR